MSFTVDVEKRKRFKVKASMKDVFEVLADVPESASYFPQVDKLIDLGDDSYRWLMDKIGLDKYYFQTTYACQYTSKLTKKEGWVKWEPIEDKKSNALISGKWTLKPAKNGGTQINFHTEGELTIALPALTKFLLSGLVVGEFEGLVDEYIESLRDAFNGVGR
jgi:ribosome-associated toxin RatA of RatAB toxin-antitoxin module